MLPQPLRGYPTARNVASLSHRAFGFSTSPSNRECRHLLPVAPTGTSPFHLGVLRPLEIARKLSFGRGPGTTRDAIRNIGGFRKSTRRFRRERSHRWRPDGEPLGIPICQWPRHHISIGAGFTCRQIRTIEQPFDGLMRTTVKPSLASRSMACGRKSWFAVLTP